MKESVLVAEILLQLPQAFPNVRCWRNNTGALKDETGRLIRFGLPGSTDISGIIAPSGRRLEIECKTETGRLRPEQAAFGEMIVRQGGVYILARTVMDAIEGVANAGDD